MGTSLPPPALVTADRTSHRFQLFSEAHDCTESHEPCLYTGIQRPGCAPIWVSQWCSKVPMKHLTSRDVFSLAGLLMAAVCFTDSSQGAQEHSVVTFSLFPSASSFQTCSFHYGYCFSPITTSDLQQGLKHPAEQFWGRVEQFLSCRDELQFLWAAAELRGPANAAREKVWRKEDFSWLRRTGLKII